MLVFSSNNDSCFCFLFTGTLRGVANIHSMTPKVAAVSREPVCRLLVLLPILQDFQDEITGQAGKTIGFCDHVEVLHHV